MTDQLDTTDLTTPEREPVPPRRRLFAMGGAAVLGAAVLAACGDDDKKDDPGGTGSDEGDTGTTVDDAATDTAIATFAAGLELLAANTYTAALSAATSGALGAVPPAVAEFATKVQAHHQAASDSLAQAAGGITPKIPADLQSAVDAGFAKVKDVPGLATFALTFEGQAAATYLEVIPKLSSKAAIDLAGSILPITRQHEAILHFVLGQYPVPDTFATTDASLAPKT